MRYIFSLVILLSFGVEMSAQNSTDYSEMLKESESIVLSQPHEAIKIANHVVQNSVETSQVVQAYLIISASNYVRGDYNNAVEASIKAKQRAEATEDVQMQIKTGVYSFPLLNHLGLNVVADGYYNKLNILVSDTGNKQNPYFQVGNHMVQAFTHVDENRFEKAYSEFSAIEGILQNSPDNILFTFIRMNVYELQLMKFANLDDATAYFETLLEMGVPNDFLKLIVYSQLGKLNFLSKNYPKSLEYYQNALTIAINFNNNYYQSQITDGFSLSYLAMKNQLEFQAHKKLTNLTYNESELDEGNAINSIYNYINSNNISMRDGVKKSYQKNLWIWGGFLTLLLISWISLRWRYHARAKQYEEYINYFEKRQETSIQPKKEVSKSLNMPKETEELLLQRLEQFENSKQFTKQDMSLAQLASNFDTNTKYLSEVINTHKNKNFNAYINDLRINYIIDKLKNNRTYLRYKISYLAEESGFSSHSSFATVFKSVTGISPTVFIDILKTKNKQSKISQIKYEQAN